MNKKDYILPALAALCIIILITTPIIRQDPLYHHFADNRIFFGIPNFLNVITNLPFFTIGLLGLFLLKKIKEIKLKIILFTLFAGFTLLSFGSGYYHWFPNNETLVFDRISMVIIFMSFFSFIIYERINHEIAFKALFILNILGLFTVFYWIITEHVGRGDLRWYGMVQFFPIIAIPLILLLYKSPFNHSKNIIPIFIFFGLAKLAEKYDQEIYKSLVNTISGHSIKHLLMALAGYKIVLMIRQRLKDVVTR